MIIAKTSSPIIASTPEPTTISADAESIAYYLIEIWMSPVSFDGEDDLEGTFVLCPKDDEFDALKVTSIDIEVCTTPHQIREPLATNTKGNKRSPPPRDSARDSKRTKVDAVEE